MAPPNRYRALAIQRLEGRRLLVATSCSDPPCEAAAAWEDSSSASASSDTFLVEGQMGGEVVHRTHSLDVAAGRIQFDFTVSTSTGDVPAVLEVEIVDAAGAIVFQLTASPGQTKSGEVTLAAGDYTARVTVTDGEPVPGTRYTLVGRASTSYLGPEVVDPSGSPITPCLDGGGEFCYPTGSISTEAFIWVDDDLAPAPDGPISESQWTDAWWQWYADLVGL